MVHRWPSTPPHFGTCLFCPRRRCGAGQCQKAAVSRARLFLEPQGTQERQSGLVGEGGGEGSGGEEAWVSAAGSDW